jgi:hypothetical protein
MVPHFGNGGDGKVIAAVPGKVLIDLVRDDYI